MQVLESETKFAHLGKPGTAFSKGFGRRLQIVRELVDLKDKKILDMGCGEGVWLEAFSNFTAWENIYGFDIDPESIEKLKSDNKNIKPENVKVSKAEELQFPDNSFDVVFSNEVFEHVEDDYKSAAEVLRVLKPGGKLIVFTPNRGWPFETHGMFFRGKYYWGNIPFLPWTPKFMRRKFSPHVRNYSNSDIKKVFTRNSAIANNSSYKVIYHKHVFPAFDKLERKFGFVGKLMQKFFHTIEKTPLHFFGISHLIILEKI